MEPHFSEDDDVEKVKRWWREYGRSILVGVVLGLLAMGGFRAWLEYKDQRAQAASQVYARLLEALAAGDAVQLAGWGQTLLDDYGSTPYADLARLAMAKTKVQEGAPAEAAELLRGVAREGATEELRQVARLRLARALLAAEQPEAALSALAEAAPGSFAGQYAAVRGDVYLAQGRTGEAREAYGEALAALPANDPMRGVLEMKRSDLAIAEGGDAAAPQDATRGETGS